MFNWQVNKDKTHEYWLALYDANGWAEVVVRFDGCIHFHAAGNVPFDDENGHACEVRSKQACDDHIHICDIDGMIESLISLREKAKQHYGDDWK